MSNTSPVTVLIELAAGGDRNASAELFALLYQELRVMAHSHVRRETPGGMLQGTALVHEAWLRLVGKTEQTKAWANRKHFFAAAAQAMRCVLVDSARARRSAKRGGDAKKLELRDDDKTWEQDEQLLSLHEALEQLEEHDTRKANLVKLRYFAGFTNSEVADQLGISTATAERDWVYAKAWLRDQMG